MSKSKSKPKLCKMCNGFGCSYCKPQPKTSECEHLYQLRGEFYVCIKCGNVEPDKEPTERTLDLVVGEWCLLHHGNTGMTENNINRLKQAIKEFIATKLEDCSQFPIDGEMSVKVKDLKLALGIE